MEGRKERGNNSECSSMGVREGGENLMGIKFGDFGQITIFFSNLASFNVLLNLAIRDLDPKI